MSGIRYGISDYTPLVLETVTWLPVAILQWMLYAVVHHALAGCKGWSSKKKKKTDVLLVRTTQLIQWVIANVNLSLQYISFS